MSEHQIGLLLIRHVKISGKPKNREFNISIVYLLYCVTPVCRSTQCTVSCKYLMRIEMMWWDILMLESLEERKVQCVTFIWGKNCQAQIQVQEKYNVWLFFEMRIVKFKVRSRSKSESRSWFGKNFCLNKLLLVLSKPFFIIWIIRLNRAWVFSRSNFYLFLISFNNIDVTAIFRRRTANK